MSNLSLEQRPPMVWIPHEAKRPFNLDALKPFGQIQYVHKADMQAAANPSGLLGLSIVHMRSLNRGFHFDRDYFLTAGGDPMINSIVSAALYATALQEIDKGNLVEAYNHLRFERPWNDTPAYYTAVKIGLEESYDLLPFWERA